MIKIDTSVDVRGIIKRLADIKDRQLPFATSLAINRTAQKVKAKEEHEIRDVFDKPTPYVQKSIFIKPSNKENLTARVWIKDETSKGTPGTKILRASIQGGERRLKRFERALRAVGAIPSGYFLIPGQKAPIDQYGNVPGSFIVKMISYFKAFPESGYRSNSTEASRAKLAKGTKKQAGTSYYVGYAGNGSQLGIWRRNHASKLSGPVKPVEPMFILTQSANYEKIFDFHFVAKTTINREFDNEFIKAFNQAKATQKGTIERRAEQALTGRVAFGPSRFK